MMKAIDMPCPECPRARARGISRARAKLSPRLLSGCGKRRTGIGQGDDGEGLDSAEALGGSFASVVPHFRWRTVGWGRSSRDPWRGGVRVPNVAGLQPRS
jgi:hypothetical protein